MCLIVLIHAHYPVTAAGTQYEIHAYLQDMLWENTADGALDVSGILRLTLSPTPFPPSTNFGVEASLLLRTPSSFSPLHAAWRQEKKLLLSEEVKFSTNEVLIPFRATVLEADDLKSQWWATAQIATAPPLDVVVHQPWDDSFSLGERFIPFPEVAGYQLLRGDFHIHTNKSRDAAEAPSPENRAIESYQYGYDVISLTDHFHMYAYDLAKDTAEQIGLIMLRGMETGMVSLTGGEHFVALWEGEMPTYQPKDEHAWSREPSGRTAFYQNQVKGIAESGGLLIYAHPNLGSGDFTAAVKWMLENHYFSGIEYRGTWRNFIFDLALEQNLSLIASSDIHTKRANIDPRQAPVTLILVDKADPAGVMEAIREGRTMAWHNEGTLVGSERWVKAYVEAAVEVSYEGGEIILTNGGGLPLRGTVYYNGGSRPVILPSLSTVVIGRAEEAPAEVEIRWANVHYGPNRTLHTKHQVAQ
ncbi:MAG TPA: hypothetical protein GXX29_04985 [Firmicutes bacterium]|nr:hypothetical protein [Bacillota bacterium]